MDEVLLNETLWEDVQQGDFDDGYRWRYRIEQTTSGPRLNVEGFADFTITVWVSWEQGSSTKQMEISTLTIAKSPGV
jgi:hypothetical protein